MEKTHARTAHEDDSKGLHDSRGTHYPCEPQEKNHTQNVLHAGQEHTYKCAHLWALQTDWHIKRKHFSYVGQTEIEAKCKLWIQCVYESLLTISVRVSLETHIHGDPLNPILTLRLLVLEGPLGYVGVVGQFVEERWHHRCAVHLILSKDMEQPNYLIL